MSDIAGNYSKIQIEDVEFRASVSESLFRRIGATINQALTVKETPLGTIEKSFLTETQFQAERGTGWILCDGRDVTGSAYATLTSRTVIPDRRGSFLRGLDNGRGYGSDTAAVVTDFGMSVLADHLHTSSFNSGPNGLGVELSTGTLNASAPEGYSVIPKTQGQALNYNIGNTGLLDTRPKNVTVNFFIRVN